MQKPFVSYAATESPDDLLEQLRTYAALLQEAARYRRDSPPLDRLLTGLERGDWRGVAEVSSSEPRPPRNLARRGKMRL